MEKKVVDVLKGKKVLITGASSGIGMACVRKFAEHGAEIIMVARSKDKMDALAMELCEKYQTRFHIIDQDVRDWQGISDWFDNKNNRLNKIDILINNAGGALGMEKLHEGNVADWDQMIDTNVKGLLYFIKKVVPLMIESGQPGHVINIGSIAGIQAYPNGAVYCACKTAVKFISDGLRMDLVDQPIKVTNIQPGMVETNFSVVRFHGDEERAKNVYKGIKPLSADDVADTVIYAASTPAHVQICEITLTPLHQSSATVVHRKNS